MSRTTPSLSCGSYALRPQAQSEHSHPGDIDAVYASSSASSFFTCSVVTVRPLDVRTGKPLRAFVIREPCADVSTLRINSPIAFPKVIPREEAYKDAIS